MVQDTQKAEYETLSELLAEGWIKAVAAWEKQHQLPMRFDRRATPVREMQPREIFVAHAEV